MPTILITGATSGIGMETAKIFGSNGWNVIITGRRKERLEDLKATLEEGADIQVLPLVFDVSDRSAVEEAISGLEGQWKEIDVLVNNAGLALGTSHLVDGDPNDWDTMIDTNIKGLLYVSKAVIPLMTARKQGHIFNLGSIAGLQVYEGGNVYCATKHAVRALSQAMRIELLPYKIRVTDIRPGAVETEFSTVRLKGDQDKADSVYQGFDPLRPEDIATCIYEAASKPSHVNINDILIMPTAQGSPFHWHKDK